MFHVSCFLFPVSCFVDNALAIQSRTIMLDSILILSTNLAVLFYLKFCNCKRSVLTNCHISPYTRRPVPVMQLFFKGGGGEMKKLERGAMV